MNKEILFNYLDEFDEIDDEALEDMDTDIDGDDEMDYDEEDAEW